MNISGYAYSSGAAEHTEAYLWKPVLQRLRQELTTPNAKVFDLGCGAGAFANELAKKGFKVSGIDPSTTGIAQARKAYPGLELEIGSTEEDLATRFGRFDAVTSLEVVEHVYAPREFAKRVFDLLKPGGLALISTPYHGYVKNVAIALSGKSDQHYTALWDHGHIKFWSIKTLSILLQEAGFADIHFLRVGRVPIVAKSMIAIVRKP